MKKDEFKEFVKNNPTLINYVRNNEMTWQKFYEIYNLYGEDNKVWDKYIKSDSSSAVENTAKAGLAGLTINEIVKWFKNVDLDSLQEGIGNVKRVLDVVQDFSKKDSNSSEKSEYKPRPLYKHFED